MFLFSNRTNCIVRTVVVTVLKTWAYCCFALAGLLLAAQIVDWCYPQSIERLVASELRTVMIATEKAASPKANVTGVTRPVNPPNETVGE